MSISIDDSTVFTQLRDKAEAQLKAGKMPPTTHWTMGVDALRMLHRLSSNPQTAEDALKLLHELQVHQVELDLQNEELATNELVLVEDLSRYRALYEYAPSGYFFLEPDGTVVEGNFAAAELFGFEREELEGRQIDTLLTPESRPLLRDLLQRVERSESRASCTVHAQSDQGGAAPLQIQAAILPGRGYVLLTCIKGSGAG